MTDIHCHILPGVDDGAEKVEQSVEMARMAWQSGVRTIIATPHCNLPGETGNYRSGAMTRRFNTLQKAVDEAGIPVKILPGAEVLGTPQVPQLLDEKKLITLAGSRYLLVEFFFDEHLSQMDFLLEAIAARGYVPVIAHPERYEAVQQAPHVVARWFHHGYVIQLNKGSILGRLGTAGGDLRPLAAGAGACPRGGQRRTLRPVPHAPHVPAGTPAGSRVRRAVHRHSAAHQSRQHRPQPAYAAGG